MAHIRMSHGAAMHVRQRCVIHYIYELWHIYGRVMAHIWMSHGTCMNESWCSVSCAAKVCHTLHQWVMAHIWMSHGTYIYELWLTYEWVMAHTYPWVMAQRCMCDTGMWYITSLSHATRDITHSYMCHDSCICVPWLIYVCPVTHSLCVCHDSFICVLRVR